VRTPYHTISGTDGENQTYHALYMLSYNDVQVTDIKLGLIDLAHNRDYEYDGETVEVETVDNGNIAINGRWDAEKYGIHLELRQGATAEGISKSPYADADGNDVYTDGETVLYPEKVIEEELGIELMRVEETEYQQVIVAYQIKHHSPAMNGLPGFDTTSRVPIEDLASYTSNDGTINFNLYLLNTFPFDSFISATAVYENTEQIVSSNAVIAERFSAKNPRVIEIEFTLNGLISYTDEGKAEDKSVEVKIEMSLDGGSTYEPFAAIQGDGITYNSSTGVSKITRQKNKVMRFVAIRTLTYEEAINCKNRIAELRIQKLTRDSTDDSNVADKVYLSAIRTWCYDYKKSLAEGKLVPQAPVIESRRNMTARLALQIDADEIEFKNQLDELNVLLTSKARTWNGTEWSEELSPTNNPASLMLMVMEHKSRGKYAYNLSEKVDMSSLGEFYEWCNQPRIEDEDDTPKFQCNGVLTNTKKTREIIDAILATARAKLILDNKRYSVWIDKPRNTPVMVLNNQNVLQATNSKSFADLQDGYKIKFVNEMTWQTDELKVLRDGVDEDTPNLIYESIELLFQTDAQQIYQNGRYLLACDKLRQEVWNRKVSVDGNLIDIGSLVEIQDDTISVGIGDGAEVKSLTVVNDEIIAVNTDGNMYVDDITKRYGIKVTCADGIHTPKVMTWEVEITNAGEQSNFVLVNPIPVSDTYKPNVGDIVSFGFYEMETTQALCFGKKDNGDGTFDLTLVPYQEGVYTADSGEIPEFDSKVCDIPQRSGGTYQVDESKESIAKLTERTIETVEKIAETSLQPYIYADLSNTGLYVDSDNNTTQTQKFSILCHVIIANEEREFSFGNISVPTGWEVSTDYHTVYVTVPANSRITKGGFSIPIRYREIFEDATLVDEEDSAYADEEDKIYHTYRLGDEILTYNIPFSYVGVKGGNYKGDFNALDGNNLVKTVEGVEVNRIPFSECVSGDYFTWTGQVTESETVAGGMFRTSRLYKYCGLLAEYTFEEDTDQTHTMNAMTDVMSVLNDELGTNKNNTAVEYLAKLVANDIFADRLVANTALVQSFAANDAFVEKLATKIISLKEGGIVKSDNYNAESIIEVDGKKKIDTSNYSDTGFAMDSFGNADFVGLHATDMVANGGTFNSITAEKALITSSLHTLNNGYKFDTYVNKWFTNFDSIISKFPQLDELAYNQPVLCLIEISFKCTDYYKITANSIIWSDSGNYHTILIKNATCLKLSSGGEYSIDNVTITLGVQIVGIVAFFEVKNVSEIIIYSESSATQFSISIDITLRL